MNFPVALKYTQEHEWIKIEGDIAVVGITDFAQGELGDIVFVEVESIGKNIAKDGVVVTLVKRCKITRILLSALDLSFFFRRKK